jgi:hypothetical protein
MLLRFERLITTSPLFAKSVAQVKEVVPPFAVASPDAPVIAVAEVIRAYDPEST